ncbi:receptor-type tyrosine-protein phosphatase epsilon-like [Haliotis asinina]|uniref:receptor-type tyrosine-protein phosphatase epsilon-like n=1 Tax=Haliotis asinina TaxID=109174 RepID=UPI00353202F1
MKQASSFCWFWITSMCWFWMGLLVACVSAALYECHCRSTTACAVFPSTPCSQVGDPDRCQEGWFGNYCQKQNVALRKPSTQSSTLGNDDNEYGAALGVDGTATTNANRRPRTCAHSKKKTNPSWTVNLNTSVPETIQHIRLYIRERLQERSNGMEILVGSQMCYNWSSTEHPPPLADVTCRQPLTGTTVTIRIPGPEKFLTLCEVQIFVCSNGWFSEDCDKQCRCVNSSDICDKITGDCPSGCFPGFNGTDCQTVCPDGTYGSNCSSLCGNCLDDVSCEKTNGTCPDGCEAGWINDTTCQLPCPDGFYGISCASQCGNCLNDVSCDKTNGTCSDGCAAGWINDTMCQRPCPDGSFGIKCSSVCGNCLDDVSCDKTNGTCPDGCAAGWINDTMCQRPCPHGFYDNNCLALCGNCLNGDICDKKNGSCPIGCASGWMNDDTKLCDQPCQDGSFGISCVSVCGNCMDGVTCDKVTGTCPKGCAVGWMNDKCNQACPNGYHGNNCAIQCGNCQNGVVCDKTNGTCPGGCAAGWMNDDSMLCIQPLAGDGPTAGIVGGVTAAVVVIAVVMAVLIFRKRRKRKYENERVPVQLDVIPTEGNKDVSDKPSSSKSASKPPSSVEEDEDAVFSVEAEVDGGNDAAATYYNWVPPHMRLDNLKQCISEKRKKDSFESEFQAIPYGAKHPHEVSIKPENISKNRFLALYAYDESRVVLTEGGEDYINANYITGYDNKTGYIATQGPKPTTVPDFWRMVWQEDVTQIVMLTRLKEMNKKKCEQYWPEGGKSEIYADCKVTNKNVTARTDYTVSEFLVENSGVERTVTHYHFTSWPDHGVPSAPALVNFWRLVKQGDMDRGPMVVHCSAGVGRTGAFIALDYLMDEAESNHINVFMCVSKMRQNRMNMVQTVKQYEFVHDVVLEALSSRGKLYTSSEFDKTFGVNDTFTSDQEKMLEEHFKLLQEQSSHIEEDITALLPENSSKNRNQRILPGNKSRPYLCTPVPGRNDYINAVFLPSIIRPSTMIVTQTPLPDTVVDFWRLVYDHDCFTVVCLDESQETDEMYPKDSNALQVSPFSITQEETEFHGACYTERRLTLTYEKEENKHSVTVFRLQSSSMISRTSSLLELINEVDRIISSGDHNILIHCHDGACVSGVFCSVLNIISRLRLDRDVDIFLTIRELQRVRPQFIQSFDQFKLCYRMVKEYNRTSNVYANL